MPLHFLNPVCTSGSSWFTNCWNLAWTILEHTLTSMRNECNCMVVWTFCGIALLWDWNENRPFPVLWPLMIFTNLLSYWVQHFHTFCVNVFNSLGHIPRSGITGSYSNFIFNFLRICHSVFQGFPISSTGEELACNAGDPGLGRAPGEGLGYPLQYFWAFLVAQMVNNLPSMWDTWVWSLCWKDPLEKGKASHSSIMAWRIS